MCEREGEREEEEQWGQHESVVSTTADARLAGPEVSSDNKSNKYNPCYPHTIYHTSTACAIIKSILSSMFHSFELCIGHVFHMSHGIWLMPG